MCQVSILVPIYNVERYVERCVRSLLEQTYNNIQYVFVDDCSPDNSVDIVKKTILDYPHRKGHVLFVSHDHNRGLSAARNTAIRNATGDFVCHVDSDDYIEHDAIENLVTTQKKSDADIVSGLSVMEKDSVKIVMESKIFGSKRERILDVIKPTLRHTIWGRLIRRSLYTEFNIEAKEGTDVGEDVQVVPILFYYANKVDCCHRLIYHYNCENENSYMHHNNDIVRLCKRYEQDVASYMAVTDFFRDKDVDFTAEAEKCTSIFAQRLMHTYIRMKDKKNFKTIKSKYSQINNKKAFASPWCYIHNRTGYHYWYCRLTNTLLSPFLESIKK